MPNHITNRLTFKGDKEEIAKLLKSIEGSYEDGDIRFIDFNKILPMPDDIYHGNLGSEEKEKYGDKNWYDWSIKNWDTKWNAYFSIKKNEKVILFQTAWSAPFAVINKLAEMHPVIQIKHEWADETKGCNSGCIIHDGNMQSGGYYENYSKDAYNVYKRLENAIK